MSHAPQNAVRPAWSKPGKGRIKSNLVEKEAVTDEEKLKRLIGKVLGVEESGLISTVKLADFEADWLDTVEILVRCEEVFEIEFGADFAVERLATVGDWLRVIRRMV